MKMKFAVLILLLIVIISGCIGHPEPPNPANNDSDRITVEVFNALNDVRVYNGLPPLKWDGILADNAAWKSCDLRTNFGHQDLYALLNDPNYVWFSSLGENIGYVGWWYDVSKMHGDFVNSMFTASHDHFVNMVNPGYNRVGIWTCIFPPGATPNLWSVYVAEEFGG